MEQKTEAKDKIALVVTTVASTIDQFCMCDIDILKQFFGVHVAANFTEGNNTTVERMEEFRNELIDQNIIIHEINFNRKPFSMKNLRAYLQVRKLLKNNHYDLIHCHTPVAAMLVRLAARRAHRHGTRIIYTAHGFHFYQGASVKNWILFYPIERWLSRYTDILITINQEDYHRALTSLKAAEVRFIPGVGINTEAIKEVIIDKKQIREEIGIPMEAFLVLSVGELNKNKNHEIIMRAMAELKNTDIYYIICGKGKLKNYLYGTAVSLSLQERVKLLGYRKDVIRICKASDAFALPSVREGLSVALMEAMASGLPVACSDIRGNRDLVEDGSNGFLISRSDEAGFARALNVLVEDREVCERMGKMNIEKAKSYDINLVRNEMLLIYSGSIPKIIHYCWFGRGEKSELIKACMVSWRKYCPSYEIMEWNEDNFDISSNSYVKEAYTMRKWAFVSDYVRLYVLYRYGGIYCDTDVEIRKPLDVFLDHNAFSGFEARDSVPTGIMGSRQGNPVIKELLQDYEQRHFAAEDGSMDLTTNVVRISDAFATWGLLFNNRKQNIKGMVIYPQRYFCPNNLGAVLGLPQRRAYTIHHFAQSWKNRQDTRRGLMFRLRRYCVRRLRNLVGSRKVEMLGKRK